MERSPRPQPAVVSIAVDGPDHLACVAVLESLARQVDADVWHGRASGIELTRVTYAAGLFEEQPLRLEVNAVAVSGAAASVVLNDVDAEILVLGPNPGGGQAGAWHEERETCLRAVPADADRPALVVFAHGHAADDSPSVGGVTLTGVHGIEIDTPVIATSADGSGIRYGIALTVRAALERLRRRDGLGLPRTAPSEPWALLDRLATRSASSSGTVQPAPKLGTTSGRAAEPSTVSVPQVTKISVPDRPALRSSGLLRGGVANGGNTRKDPTVTVARVDPPGAGSPSEDARRLWFWPVKPDG